MATTLYSTISGGYYPTSLLTFVSEYVYDFSDWALIQTGASEWRLVLGSAADPLTYSAGKVITIIDYSGNSYRLSSENVFDNYTISNPNNFIFYGSEIADIRDRKDFDFISSIFLPVIMGLLFLIYSRMGDK